MRQQKIENCGMSLSERRCAPSFTSTPTTDVLVAKDCRRKKLTSNVETKISEFFETKDIGNRERYMNRGGSDELHQQQMDSNTQNSVSSVSTNCTIDYERLERVKHISEAKEDLNHSNTMLLKDKNCHIKLKNQMPLDFKQFLDDTQRLKLEREQELVQKAAEKSKIKLNLLDNFDKFKKSTTLSSGTLDLISTILKKKDQTNVLQTSEQSRLPQKLDLISDRLLRSAKQEDSSHKNEIPKKNEFPNEKNEKIQDEGIKEQSEESELSQNILMTPTVGNGVVLERGQEQNTPILKSSEIIVKGDESESEFSRLLRAQQWEKSAEIMQKPSVRERYEELIKSESVEYTLPYRYKLLLSCMEKLEECIAYFNERKKCCLFYEIKENMETSMRSSISLKQVQQILTVYPTAYRLKWVKSEHNSEKYELFIQPSSDENESQSNSSGGARKQERLSKLSAGLVDKVRYYHNIFLKSRGLENLENELHQLRVWHSEFDLQNVPHLEECPLPLRPNEIRVESLHDTLAQNSVKNTLLASLFQTKANQLLQKEELKKEIFEKSLYIPTQNNKSGLTDRLYQLIKAKELKIQEDQLKFSLSKQQLTQNADNPNAQMQTRLPEIKKVVEIIIVYYIQRKVSNIFYVSLIEHIHSTSTMILSKQDIIQIIDFLIQQCPFWITSIPNKQGNIIRIDKSLPISKILAQIDK